MGIFWFVTITLVLTFVLYVAYHMVLKALDTMHPARKVTLKTELPYFKEANTNDVQVNKGKVESQSISMMYEEMCVNNPEEYEDDARVQTILKQYKDILLGRTLDPNGEHIPSETINDMANPDYLRYLRNQKKALKKAGHDVSWMGKEGKRAYTVSKFEELRGNFIDKLEEKGIPNMIAQGMATDERMESYKPEQWDALTESVLRYLEEFEERTIQEYLHYFEGDILNDTTSLEKYNVLRENEVPIQIAIDVIKNDISDEQMYDILHLIDDKAYDPEEAVEEVLGNSVAKDHKRNLQEKYRAQLARR